MSGSIGFREWSWSLSSSAVDFVATTAAAATDFSSPPPAWVFESQGVHFDAFDPIDRWRYIDSLAALSMDDMAANLSESAVSCVRGLVAVATAYQQWRDADDADVVDLLLAGRESYRLFYDVLEVKGFAERADLDGPVLPTTKPGLSGVAAQVKLTMGELRAMDAAVSKGVGQEGRRLFEPGPRVYEPTDFESEAAAREYPLAIAKADRRWKPFISRRGGSQDAALHHEHNLNFFLDDRISAGRMVAPALFESVDPLLEVRDKCLVVSAPQQATGVNTTFDVGSGCSM